MRLTPEGEKLYAHISAAVGHIEAGESEIISAKNLETGSVSVAASETALRCHLLCPVCPEKIPRSAPEDTPAYRKPLYPPQAIEALKNGFADIAVVTTPTMDVASLIEKKVRRLNQVAVCGAGFPELAGRRVPLGEIASLPLISLGAETKNIRALQRVLRGEGVQICAGDRGGDGGSDTADGRGGPWDRLCAARVPRRSDGRQCHRPRGRAPDARHMSVEAPRPDAQRRREGARETHTRE